MEITSENTLVSMFVGFTYFSKMSAQVKLRWYLIISPFLVTYQNIIYDYYYFKNKKIAEKEILERDQFAVDDDRCRR